MIDGQKGGLMGRKTCGKFLALATAVLILLFPGRMKAMAGDTFEEKPVPAVQMLLLSVDAPRPGPPNIAFVTSLTYDGNLATLKGGLAGADKKCDILATAAGLPRNTYRAWLSTSTVNAIDRLGSARGWVRVDGKPFADTKEDIAAGKIFHPLRVDENGDFDNTPGGSEVWTATKSDGTMSSWGTCGDWASNAGDGGTGMDDGVTSVFTDYGDQRCDYEARLYCFGTDRNVPVTVNPVAGRVAFITRGFWTPAGGLVGADGVCQAEAESASLSGTFKALLAANGASAASRFDSSGLPWVRPDGVAIAPTAAALFAATFLNTAINQLADGTSYLGNYGVWTGAASPTASGTAASTCDNWTVHNDTLEAWSGTAAFTYREKFFAHQQSKCNATWLRLYCLQS